MTTATNQHKVNALDRLRQRREAVNMQIQQSLARMQSIARGESAVGHTAANASGSSTARTEHKHRLQSILGNAMTIYRGVLIGYQIVTTIQALTAPFRKRRRGRKF